MTDCPLLRLPNPRNGDRRRRARVAMPAPEPRSRSGQSERFGTTFERLEDAFTEDQPTLVLRQDPAGIAPERALVFETQATIANFARVAGDAGLEILSEDQVDYGQERRTLYATLPTQQNLENMLRRWRRYGENKDYREGEAPWWKLFDHLTDLRVWGPEDRFPEGIIAYIRDHLPFDDEEPFSLEFELWPTRNDIQREHWREELRSRIAINEGRILDSSTISDGAFIYVAFLVEFSTGSVRALLDNPQLAGSLAQLDGVRFILPQTIGQSGPAPDVNEPGKQADVGGRGFDLEAPSRLVLLDGVPVAAHPDLDGGLSIEDVHDIVPRSEVAGRHHATQMASLILRGDLEADGTPIPDSRIISIPILVDDREGNARSPEDRLFVDIVHIALVRAFEGEAPLAPDAFVVNLSVGVPHIRFAGRMSALSQLLDWWTWKTGVLFVISAGNILDPLNVSDMSLVQFDSLSVNDQSALLRRAQSNQAYERSIMAPAESINGLTVGALSEDASPSQVAPINGQIEVTAEGAPAPQLSSGLGLGWQSAIKPEIMMPGGRGFLSVAPSGDNLSFQPRRNGFHGMVAASAGAGRTRHRGHGTSHATALTSRLLLQVSAELTGQDGPYAGQELDRRTLALLTRALVVNAGAWPESRNIYLAEASTLGHVHHIAQKKHVAKQWGFGRVEPLRALESPASGATLIGTGVLRRDRAQVFDVPLPPSLSGQKIGRDIRVTIAWNSPVDSVSSTYRLAKLEAQADTADATKDNKWGLDVKSDALDINMIGKGTVWSHRLRPRIRTAPAYGENAVLPIRVQASGPVSQDDDIHYAIAVSLEVEVGTEIDVYQEIQDQLRVRLSPRG